MYPYPNKEMLEERIRDLSKKAEEKFLEENYESSLEYLLECEKNLEYSANLCCCEIPQYLLISVLQNLASTYQRIWELSVCYCYVEGLIYNLVTEDELWAQRGDGVWKRVERKRRIARCYLQFSALSSQMENHAEAKSSVLKSMKYLEETLSLLPNHPLILSLKSSLILPPLRPLPSPLTLPPLKSIEEVGADSALGAICEVSMGDIMQIQFQSLEENNKESEEQMTNEYWLLHLCIEISCAFFALATEIRLANAKNSEQRNITEKQCENCEKLKKTMQSHKQNTNNYNKICENCENFNKEFHLAKIYHWHSIEIVTKIVAIESVYLKHILKSFNNNFKEEVQVCYGDKNKGHMGEDGECESREKEGSFGAEKDENEVVVSQVEEKKNGEEKFYEEVTKVEVGCQYQENSFENVCKTERLPSSSETNFSTQSPNHNVKNEFNNHKNPKKYSKSSRKSSLTSPCSPSSKKYHNLHISPHSEKFPKEKKEPQKHKEKDKGKEFDKEKEFEREKENKKIKEKEKTNKSKSHHSRSLRKNSQSESKKINKNVIKNQCFQPLEEYFSGTLAKNLKNEEKKKGNDRKTKNVRKIEDIYESSSHKNKQAKSKSKMKDKIKLHGKI